MPAPTGGPHVRAGLGSTQSPADNATRRLISTLLVVVLASAGTILIALADAESRAGRGSAQTFFWAGIALIVIPASIYLCSASPTRTQRYAMVATVGLAFYTAKVTYNPAGFFQSDEYVHLRTAQDLLATHHLFSFNPLLPEASHYPGLAIAASALSRAAGMPLNVAALLLIGSARLILTTGLFLVVERLTMSARAAGIAAMIYAANPNFMYWSAQFSYESLALPLLVLTVYLIILRARLGRSLPLDLAILMAAVSSILTHHLSAYLLCTILVLWALIARLRRFTYAPVVPALFAVAGTIAWFVLAAPLTGGYLGGIAGDTAGSVIDVLSGAAHARKLFTTGSQVAPEWERALGIAGVVALLSGLAVAAPKLWRQRGSLAPGLVVVALSAYLFPITLPLRFAGRAQETSNRATEFLYIGVGTVLAWLLVGHWLDRGGRRRLRQLVAGSMIAVVVGGGVTVAAQYSQRLPARSDAHSFPDQLVSSQIAADSWAAGHLGPGRRIMSDFVSRLGLATYARQRTLWQPDDHAADWQALLPSDIGPGVRRALETGRVEFALAEGRLSWGLPSLGFIFNRGEPGQDIRKTPLSAAIVHKFAPAGPASVVYDNGYERIYDVAHLR